MRATLLFPFYLIALSFMVVFVGIGLVFFAMACGIADALGVKRMLG